MESDSVPATDCLVLAVLQARVSSTRLPGKVLKPILGQPMLARHIERLRRSQCIDKLIVATSGDSSDDPVAALCDRLGLSCFRGSLNDVLDRVYRAALPYKPQYLVRLTGDCPLADPAIIDATIQLCVDGGFDYASNTLEATFPDGLDVEVVRYTCLEQAWHEANLPSQREHVTPFIYQHPLRFRLASYKSPSDFSQLRWTVDEPEDLKLIETIYNSLYPSNPSFSMNDVLALVEQRPELRSFNSMHVRNEGYERAMQSDFKSYPSARGE